MLNYKEYNQYLSKVSLKGFLYKKFILYPKLVKNLPHPALDIGCGIGKMLEFYPQMTGVDINEFNIQICTDNGLNAVLMTPDLLPFQSNSFNSILLDNVLEHIADPTNILFEISRVLNDKGILVIGLPGDNGYLQDSDHKINYSSSQFTNLMSSFGFRLEDIFFSPFKSNYLNIKASFYCRYFIFSSQK